MQRLDKLIVAIIHRAFHRRAETELGIVFSLVDDFVQIDKCAAAKEQDVGCVKLIALLIGVLSSALRGNVGNGAFDDFEKCLLHAFAAHVTSYGHILAFLCDFVDFVDINDADFCAFEISVGGLDELEKDVFNVFTHKTCLGGRG